MKHTHLILISILLLSLLVGCVQALTWQSINGSPAGGWTATNGTYNWTMFNVTGSGTWTPPTGVTSIQYLIVAGGGSGGKYDSGISAGGGAGGFRTSCSEDNSSGGLSAKDSALSVTAGISIPIGVGAGGAKPTVSDTTNNGGDSYIGSGSEGTTLITAKGGGGGAPSGTGNQGGCGGGDRNGPGAAALTSPTVQGFRGGLGSTGDGGSGGGGGAGTVGHDQVGGTVGGQGGHGLISLITGASVTYASGGGGSAQTTPGDGGLGDGTGKAAKYSAPSADATQGTDGLGNGGGGGATTAGAAAAGGSGIVIIRYALPLTAPVSSFASTNVSAATNSTSESWAGIAPFTMVFNDTSTGSPTTWNWSYQGYGINTTYSIFSTLQSPTNTFVKGNWSVGLNVTNVYGYNNSIQKTFVNVSTGPSPISSFTSNWLSGSLSANVAKYELFFVQFNDTTTWEV